MQIVLLSGGSGSRLWPLSNDARSKQFLRILESDSNGTLESMMQRVYRQLRHSGIEAEITVATSMTQVDSVIAQLGNRVNIVAEPSRRDTFPAVSLACEYLSKEKHCTDDEIVVVMPCDPYTEAGYFETIMKMTDGINRNYADLIVMGINPSYPSAKFGYIIPDAMTDNGVVSIKQFTEKPSVTLAEQLIAEGAMWNGGVFAFRLGYLTNIARKYNNHSSFSELREHYVDYPKISFDYEVAEKAHSIAMVKFDGKWKDLGTWNALTEELKTSTYGNVITDGSQINTHIINELNLPILCIGTEDLVIAASPDGIIVSDKDKSESIKDYAAKLKHRPMYEERRWGIYRVLDNVKFPDGYCVLTKQLTLNPGCSISYQQHLHRDEVWTIIDGSGIIVLDGVEKSVQRGDVIDIKKGQKHALKAISSLSLIEVQKGTELVEEDIERYEYDWK